MVATTAQDPQAPKQARVQQIAEKAHVARMEYFEPHSPYAEMIERTSWKTLPIEAAPWESNHVEVPGQLDHKLHNLKNKLTVINDHLAEASAAAQRDFDWLSDQASTDLRAGIRKLTSLADFIQGDWSFSSDTVDQANAIADAIEGTFNIAIKSAETTVDGIRYHEGAIARIRDADLLGLENGLKSEMTEFQNEIKSWVHRTEQELEVSQKILEGNRETMENSQRDLDNATARYEEAVSDSKIPKAGEDIMAWTHGGFAGIDLRHTASQKLIQDVSYAKSMVDQAQNHQQQVQNDIKTIETRAKNLTDIQNRFSQLLAQALTLESSITQMADMADVQKRASIKVKDQTIATWASGKAVTNAATTAAFVLTKIQYANAILETLDNARFDKSIKPEALNVLNNLKDHDDGSHSVSKISKQQLTGSSYLQVLLDQYSQM